jgi:predicted  nucleic acid-binding Zn-ribbon protein
MSQAVSPVLRECHRLRRHLRELQAEIERGPRVLKAQQKALADAEAAHKEHHDAIKRWKLKQKDDEGTLKTTETRLLKLQTDINNAGSKKEFDAKTHEIEMATARKGELEDAVLTAITEVEERTASAPAADKTWADAQTAFKQQQLEAAERLERLKADQIASTASLEVAEAKIPPENRGQYNRIVKSHGPDGLAAVEGRTCMNCRTSLTEQQKTSLAGGAFVCCPQCGRALYLAGG